MSLGLVADPSPFDGPQELPLKHFPQAETKHSPEKGVFFDFDAYRHRTGRLFFKLSKRISAEVGYCGGGNAKLGPGLADALCSR